MIDTIQTKAAQLEHGYYQRGTGPEEILILGSCRTVAFLNYLVRWNDSIGQNRFTIRRIDPCDWTFSGIDIQTLETDERILSVIKSCDIFIHEYLVNYGMFNTGGAGCDENIYDYGMRPEIDISIPNFNDHMILENDWIDYGSQTPDNYQELGEAEVIKFCHLCSKTSFPEFCDIFLNTWRQVRYFWRPNHTSALFTMAIFSLMNHKFLDLHITSDFANAIAQEDLFAEPCTAVTDRDRKGYGITW